MNRSIITTPSNSRVFIACLLALTILMTPIAAVAIPAEAKPAPKTDVKTAPQAPAEPQLPQAVPAPLFVPEPATPFAPSLSATLTDNFPLASKKNPGGQIDYTATITNGGINSPADDALAVIFNAPLDNNTTLVPGSIHASPIAFNDTYNWVGNTVLDTSLRSLPSITANDVALNAPGGTDTFTLNTTPTTGPSNGSVTIAPSGHFVYTPNVGFSGTDSFTYTIANNVDPTLTNVGTVNIVMPVRVWYLVFNGVGDGRSHTPSGSPSAMSIAANAASDIFYVYFNAGTLNGPFTLESGQALLGEGVPLVANSITLRPAGSTPTITNTTGDAVTLGGNNLVTGLNISQPNNFAIAGNAIGGTTNVTGVAITNSGSGGGLSLTTQSGTITLTNSPISGTTSGTAVFVSGGIGAINFSNSPVSRTTGRLLDIQNKTGGSVLLNGGSTVTGTAITTDAIVLRNHTGISSLSFLNNVQVTTTNGRGIQADNSSGSFVLIMNAAANTISATNGAALDVEDLAATTALAFTSISSTNSSIVPAHGLRVNNTNGTLNFGNATLNSSGNTGALLTSNASTITFADLDIAPDSGVRGFHATGNTGTITTTSGDVVAVNATAVEIVGTSSLVRTPLNMTLTKVSSASNAANGLLLQHVNGPGASVGFVVVGDGTNTTVGGNATGGTITGSTGGDGATSGNAVYMENADEVTLRRMTINGTNQNHGIRGVSTSNFTLEYSTVTGTNGTSTGLDEGSVNFDNLTVAAAITSCLLEGGLEENLNVVNTTGTLNRLVITGTTFGFNNTTNGNNNILIESFNAGTVLNYTLQSSIIKGAKADWLNNQPSAGGSMDSIIGGSTPALGNSFDNTGANVHPSPLANGNRILLNANGTHTFNVTNNTIKGSLGNALAITAPTATAVMSGEIEDNDIGVAATPNSGSTGAGGISIQSGAGGDITVLIDGNDVRQYNNHGIIFTLGDQMGGVANISATVSNNTVNTPGTLLTDFNGFHINNGTVASDNLTSCFNIFDNNFSASGKGAISPNNSDVRLRQRQATTIQLPGYTGPVRDNGDLDVAEVITYLRPAGSGGLKNNTFVTGNANSVSTGGGYVNSPGGAPCSIPALMFAENPKSLRHDLVPADNTSQLDSKLNVNRTSLLAQASVTGHRRSSSPAVNPSTSEKQVRFAHARSNRQSANSAVANSSFAAPMWSGENINIGGVTGFTLPAAKTVTIKYSATISNTPTAASVSTKGTISPGPGGNFASFETNDPETGGGPPNDPTVTNLNMPDLTVVKSHVDTFKQGDTGKTYTITVTNTGTFATFAGNTVSVSDTVPSGLTATAISGTNWTCTQPAGPCTRTDSLAASASYEPITLTVNVANNAPALVTNTAVIANGSGGEVNNANNSDDDPTTIVQAPDLTIDKAHVGNFFQGQTGATYTITVGNAGPGPVLAGETVTVTDVVPSGLTATSISGTDWSCTQPSGPCTRTGAFTALPVGNNYPVITLTVNVATNAPTGAGAVTNSASVTGGGEINTANNTDNDPTTINAGMDLSIDKSHSDIFTQGDTGKTYSIVVSNVGGTATSGTVTVTDVVPTGLTPTAPIGAHNGWTCAIVSQTLTCDRADSLAGAASYPAITLTVNVSLTAPASVTNTASVAGGGNDINLANNSDDDPTTINALCSTPPANMTNWWTGDGTPRDVAGGKDGTLNGAGYGTGKVLQGFSFDGVDDYVDIGDVDFTTDKFTIDAWVNPTNLTNEQAIVNKDNGVLRSYLFNITNTGALRAVVYSGGNVTEYQTAAGVVTAGSLQHVAVTYDGAAAANLKMLFYKNGALVASTMLSDTGGTPDNVALAARIGRSNDGSSAFIGVIDELEFFSRVLAAAELLTIFNADAGGKCKPSDLTITKTHTDPFIQGSTGNTYTITVHNDGPAATTGTTTVTENLPAGLTATALSGPGWTCPGVYPVAGPAVRTCTSTDAIASGADFPLITLTVDAGVNMASVTNNVTVSGGGDMDASDNSDDDLTNLTPSSDLLAVKVDTPDPVIASQNITYTVTLTNNGPSDAATVTLTDTVPTNTTFVSAIQNTGPTFLCVNPPGGGTGNVSCSIATFPTGAVATFTIVVNVNASTAEGTIITNNAVAASTTNDPMPANNTGVAMTTVNQSDIEITSKTDTPDPVTAGQDITYTINFKNNSAVNTASNVTVTDAVPANTTLVSATTVSPGWARTDVVPVGGTGNIVFSKALVAAAETAVFTIVVKVNASVLSGTTITNTATAATTSIDTNSANNSATATTTTAASADLEITSKTDLPDPVIASQNITYAINFVNNGPSDAQTVTITDAVPTGTTFVSAAITTGTGWTIPSPPPVGGTGNVVFSKATVAAGETATFEVVVKVDNNALEGSIITNNAVAASATTDPTPGNNTGTATTTVNQSDIEITSKTDTPDPVTAGQDITYTINFKNNSAVSTASNVTVTDAVPTGTTLVSATTVSPGWARTDGVLVGGTGNIVFSKALVAAAETAVFTIVVKVNASVLSGTIITNTATAATSSIDTNSANNSASATTTTAASADLQITSKTDAPDPVTAGENITYTINFINNGPSDAQTVTVTDAMPVNTTFVSAAITLGPGWSISSQPAVGGTGNVVFSKATVAAGETATFQVVVKVNSSTPAATVISNDAVAASATTDPTPANNTGNATTTVVTSADLLVVKVESEDPVAAGANLTYTITVTNGGSSDAQNLSLSDTLPPNTTLVSFTVPGGWTRTDVVPVGGTGTVTATAPTLVSGTSAVFTLVVNVDAATPHNTVLTNSATVTSTTTDPNPVNNTGTEMTTVVSQPDLTVTKTHTGNFAQGQVGATFTITVNNIGSGPTNGSPVTVTDNVPVGLTPTGPVGAHNGWTCSIIGQMVTCTRSDVLAGNSSYPAITLTVTVANPAPLNVTNTATVSGGGAESNSSNNSGSDSVNIDCTPDAALNNTSQLMISRFRMNGPAGSQDEFVEIYNPTTTDHTVAVGNCTGGYSVLASAGNGTASNAVSQVCQIPNGTVIPAGGYYLCTGVTYSLSSLGYNGGAEGATAVSDAPIGCGGSCLNDIPNDAGLALIDVGANIVTLCTIGPGCPTGFNYTSPGAGNGHLYDRVGFSQYGPGAPPPGNGYPSLAGNFCEGAACLRPVGDASTGAICTNPSGLFPVVSAPPACYGLAGQYELLRRQTTFDANLGTVHQDTGNSANDWLLVAPNSAVNMGLGLTGVSGVTAIHGAAGPQGSTAPADTPSTSFKQDPFDLAKDQLTPPNAERSFALDPTVADPDNNPLGTFSLRLRFTNNSASSIAGLRFRVDDVATLCGPQTATPTTGSGNAKNLAAAPDCGTGSFTAILKLLNSAQEVVVDSTSTAQTVRGTVMEDLSASATPTPPGAGPLSPKGGGLDSSLIVNPSTAVASVGDGVTGGSGVFATVISTTNPNKVIRVKIKFGVVRSGRFIVLITPMATSGP